MKLISLFDGIGGFPLAWCNVTGQAPADLQYQSSEIEPWPMAVVQQRFPNVEELGDVVRIDISKNMELEAGTHNTGSRHDDRSEQDADHIRHKADNESAKLEQPETGRSVSSAGSRASADDHIITFGSPCQDLSIAGRGAGLTAERSGLFHAAMRLVRDVQPRFFIWENVVGAFSSNNGNDFAKVLQSTADLGYDAVWTVLDAQWCGVPQRRRRIFLLGVRDGIPAGADIFSFGRRAARICRDEIQLITDSRSRNHPKGGEARPVTAALTADGVGTCGADDNQAQAGHLVQANPNPVIMAHDQSNAEISEAVCASLNCNHEQPIAAITPAAPVAPVMRRLTPVECLRLQGFPDDWFEGVPGYSDTKAYRAIGNSVAIPCVEWIFQRVLKFDEVQ